MIDQKQFVLLKRGLYWRPEGRGYTGLLREAGLYSLDDAALAHCEYMLTPKVKTTTEYMLRDDAPEFAPACCKDVMVEELKAQIERLTNTLCLADNIIMQGNGGFPLDGALRKYCMAIRSLTGGDFRERQRRGQKALEDQA